MTVDEIQIEAERLPLRDRGALVSRLIRMLSRDTARRGPPLRTARRHARGTRDILIYYRASIDFASWPKTKYLAGHYSSSEKETMNLLMNGDRPLDRSDGRNADVVADQIVCLDSGGAMRRQIRTVRNREIERSTERSLASTCRFFACVVVATTGCERRNDPSIDHNAENAPASAPVVVRKEPSSPAIGDLSIEQAREEIEKRIANASPRDRAVAAGEVIGEMCKAGRTEDAWELIQSDYGDIRVVQLSRFFREADLPPKELLSRMMGLEYRFEDKAALTNYFKRFPPGELAELVLRQC